LILQRSDIGPPQNERKPNAKSPKHSKSQNSGREQAAALRHQTTLRPKQEQPQDICPGPILVRLYFPDPQYQRAKSAPIA